MRTKKTLSVALLLVVVVFACRKDYSIENKPSTPSYLSQAKDYYYKQAKALGITRVGLENTTELKTQATAQVKAVRTISPIWRKSYSSKTSGLTFIEVPIISNVKYISLYNMAGKPANDKINVIRANASLKRLLVYQTAKGSFHQLQLTYVPDYDYLEKHNFDASGNQINKLDSDFSGYIEYSSLKDERKIFVLRFEKGRLVSKMRLKPRSGTNQVLSGKQQASAGKQQASAGKTSASKDGTNTVNGGHFEQECVPKWGQICIEAGDPLVEYCGEWEVVGEDCYDVWVEDPEPEPDPCYDEDYVYICDVENPDPEEPVMGCDGVPGSGAYMADCGCIGGSTGITECAEEDDPCAKKGAIDGQASNTNNSLQRDTILANMGTNEYGAEQKLVSKTATSGFKQVPVRTDGSPSSMGYNFGWGPTGGYTIGFTHSHPLGSAPSLDDVFTMGYSSAFLRTNVSVADAEFYEARSSVTVVTSSGTYVATVKDWPAFRTAYATFKANETASNANYLSIAAANGNSTAFALLNILGSSINLYKAASGTTNFKPMKIENGSVKTTDCP